MFKSESEKMIMTEEFINELYIWPSDLMISVKSTYLQERKCVIYSGEEHGMSGDTQIMISN